MTDQLLEKLIKGDVQVFEDIYRAYHLKVYNFILRYTQDSDTSRELAQIAFIKLWEKRERLHVEKSFDSQFFVMIRNLTIDAMRKQARMENLREAYQETYQSVAETTDHTVAHAELSSYLEAAIQKLPEKRQEIFRLNRQQGLSYKEIADKLSVSTKTVENQMGRALKFLKEELGGFLSVFL